MRPTVNAAEDVGDPDEADIALDEYMINKTVVGTSDGPPDSDPISNGSQKWVTNKLPVHGHF